MSEWLEHLQDWWAYHRCNLELRWRLFVMWKVTGWPFKRRCPLCAGDGDYASETMARYGDDSVQCDMCKGTGRVPR